MLRHERPSEQAHRRPIQVARRETRPIHQSQKTAVRLPPLERQTVEQELVERVVDQRGVVGLGLLRLGVYHAIWRPEQNVEDTELRAAPVPGVALRHLDRALPTKHKAHHAGLVLEGHVLTHAKARFPREVALVREHPRLLVLAHHGFSTLNTGCSSHSPPGCTLQSPCFPWVRCQPSKKAAPVKRSSTAGLTWPRSEEHTSELQSRFDLVCRLLLEKKDALGVYLGALVRGKRLPPQSPMLVEIVRVRVSELTEELRGSFDIGGKEPDDAG